MGTMVFTFMSVSDHALILYAGVFFFIHETVAYKAFEFNAIHFWLIVWICMFVKYYFVQLKL